jgi:uncharacterized YigZ family protein
MDLPISKKVISSTCESKFKEKGSLFIGTAFPVCNEEEALSKLADTRKKYYDATHNCYAYLINDGKSKYSDDGEPNGTAGIRIFNAIKHFDVTDLLLVSTRYFGGTKLGVGPLGKAYYDSAANTLENAQIVTKNLFQKIVIEFPYDYSNLVHRTITKFSARIIENEYSEKPTIHIFLPGNNPKSFNEELKSTSNGIVKTLNTNEFVYF